MRLLVAACLLSSCAVTPTLDDAQLVPHVDADVSDAVPLLGELVRGWSSGGAPEVRRVVGERLRQEGSDVVDGLGFLVAGSGPLLLLVRLADVPACRDPEGGVVVGEPPRLIGCGTQELFGVAAFTLAARGHLGSHVEKAGVTLAIVDDDAALLLALAGRAVTAAWTPGGVLLTGADRDVFDVVAVDVGRLSLALSVPAPDADRLVVAAGRAVSFVSAPRLPVVVADRLAVLDAGLFRERAVDLARDPQRRALVVDGCSLESFSTERALLLCRALPGRALQDVVDDVVLAIDDPAVRVQVVSEQEPSSTSLLSPLGRGLAAAARRGSPRVVTAPALDTGLKASACHRLRGLGVPCLAALPLRLHPALRERRGQRDEIVPADAVVAAAAFVVDVVAAVPEVLR
ncbi:MAG: hypothetical protein Q8O67_25885 [Deltaproteobacteria bacterium]|nr:hypothetical protein [Deltaproteobacteria bacterium]